MIFKVQICRCGLTFLQVDGISHRKSGFCSVKCLVRDIFESNLNEVENAETALQAAQTKIN